MAKNRWSLIIAVFGIAAGPYCCSDDDDDQSSNNVEAGAESSQCAQNAVQHTSSSGKVVCCPGDMPTFCDENSEGYTGGCWPEESDCETVTKCGGQWASCPFGALPICNNAQLQCLSCSDASFIYYSASGKPFCCETGETFCDENDQGYQGGCWDVGVDCQTIAQCNGTWHACGSGMVVVCDAAGGQGFCIQN